MQLSDLELVLILASLQAMQESRADNKKLNALYNRIDAEISFEHKNPGDFMVNLNLEWELLCERLCVFRKQRDEGRIPEARWDRERIKIHASFQDLMKSMRNGPEAWRVCDSLISFQAPEGSDNYIIDDAGKAKFPYMRWDSESGNGFVNLNEEFVTDVTNWLIEMNCDEISSSQPPWYNDSYVNDPAIVGPVAVTD